MVFVEGMMVKVRWPLQGVHGILSHEVRLHQLMIAVRLIQQAAAVRIDLNDVVQFSLRSVPGLRCCERLLEHLNIFNSHNLCETMLMQEAGLSI